MAPGQASKKEHSVRSFFGRKNNRKPPKPVVKEKQEQLQEPANQNNIDYWFYKNFNLGKLFEDDEGSSMDEKNV